MANAIKQLVEVLKDLDDLSSYNMNENASDYLSVDSDSDDKNGKEIILLILKSSK